MIKLFACDLDGTLLNLFHTTDDKIRGFGSLCDKGLA